jgi:hypothetical protein
LQDLKVANHALANELVRMTAFGSKVTHVEVVSVCCSVAQHARPPCDFCNAYTACSNSCSTAASALTLTVALCLQEKLSLQEQVAKLELLVHAQHDKLVSSQQTV